LTFDSFAPLRDILLLYECIKVWLPEKHQEKKSK